MGNLYSKGLITLITLVTAFMLYFYIINSLYYQHTGNASSIMVETLNLGLARTEAEAKKIYREIFI